MDLGGYSATGPRDTNEDSHYECSFPTSVTFLNGVDTFVMVSDGMGGYQGGDVASSLTTSSAKRYLQNLFDMANGKTIEFKPGVALAEIVGNSHEAIVAETRARSNASMGATFLGAFISPTHAWIGHVGDSRAYLIRNGEAHQLTVDHSQVGRLLSGGVITEKEAQTHPDRNRIERALGFENHAVEITEVDLMPGDGLLLCSDGLYTVLDKALLASTCMSGRNAQESAKLVVEKALANDTDDNTTAVVAFRPSDGADVVASRSTQPTITQHTPAHAAGKWDDVADESQGKVQSGVQGVQGGAQGKVQGSAQGKAPDSQSAVATQRIRPIERPNASPQPAGQRPSRGVESRRRSRESEPAQASKTVQKSRTSLIPIVIPIAIFVVLIGVIVWLFVVSRTSQTATTVATPASQTEPTVEERPGSSVSSQRSVEDVETYGSYEVTEDAVLRYIDKDGVAQLFAEQFPTITNAPYAPAGSAVRAASVEDSFNRYDQMYRKLDDEYLVDLQDDLGKYRQGITEFSSGLSRIVEPTSYRELLEALKGMSETSLENDIRGLLLRSQDLVSRSSGTSGSPSSNGVTGQSDMTGPSGLSGASDAGGLTNHSSVTDAGDTSSSTSLPDSDATSGFFGQ